jgi:hypothetical protein
MSDPITSGRESLRDAARQRIEQLRLPSRKPTRIWGGRGTGLPCSLCDKPILDTEPEMELEYADAAAGATVRFHLQCQSVWDEVRQMRTSPWTLVSTSLPPLFQIVEARIALGAARSVILSVMRVNHGDTGPLVWLNTTTNSALPENWRPVEWRALADPSHSVPPEIVASRTQQRA